ncbi:hypothetical protein FGO68_gene6814 [Halteria grandinella]|uniref:Leishmanolysin-like peptidase n=1 Tax=Halteria grandinella TaxID=5974 RepID=A0A8J8SUH3_HALGN|nr:hypothetical protein FGO68_gene6814 [Halteria grandinella]
MLEKQLLFILFILQTTCSPSARKLSERTLRKLDSLSVNTSAPWEPLRVTFEYVNDPNTQTRTFLDSIFSIAGVYFQKHLLIRRSSSSLTVTETIMSEFQGFIDLPSDMLSKTYDTDLVLIKCYQVFYVSTMNNDSDNTLASCAPIDLDSSTGRPVFAGILWNMAYSDPTTLTNVGFEAQLATAVHEMLHGLGFVSDLFSKFYDSVDGTVYTNSSSTDANSVILLQTPRVVAQAQKHFACSDITGVPMENEGGSGTAGSHWERALFYNEMMTGSDMVSSFAITDFTLQLLQDSGQYIQQLQILSIGLLHS